MFVRLMKLHNLINYANAIIIMVSKKLYCAVIIEPATPLVAYVANGTIGTPPNFTVFGSVENLTATEDSLAAEKARLNFQSDDVM